MKPDPERHRRRSVRLSGYDYSQAGAYFVTICTKDRACLLGEIAEGAIHFNDAGTIVEAAYHGLPGRFPSVAIDEFMVMPNHVHGIIVVGAQFIASLDAKPDAIHRITDQGAINRAPTLGDVVRAFKAVSTRQIRMHANPRFAWQRNYYEHVIRDDTSLDRIRQYIADNPLQWAMDRENPDAVAACRGALQRAPTKDEPWRV